MAEPIQMSFGRGNVGPRKYGLAGGGRIPLTKRRTFVEIIIGHTLIIWGSYGQEFSVLFFLIHGVLCTTRQHMYESAVDKFNVIR